MRAPLLRRAKERTATAVCETDVEQLVVPYERLMQTYYQNPGFAVQLVRLIAGRLKGAGPSRAGAAPA